MKKEDITGLIVYLVIIALAVVYGFAVLQTHSSESTLSGFSYVLYIIGAVLFGTIFNAILLALKSENTTLLAAISLDSAFIKMTTTKQNSAFHHLMA